MSRLSALLVACVCVFVLVSSSSFVAGEQVVSERLQQLLAEDHREFVAGEFTPKKQQLTIEATDVYTPDVATAMRWHSVTAYCNDLASIQDWTCASCSQFGDFTVTAVMNTSANQGYVGYFTQGLPGSPINDGTNAVDGGDPFVLVSFRGTVPSELQDWIEDLSFSKLGVFSDSYPAVEVHSGFWGSYQLLRDGMLTGLSAALQASGATTILFAGHSLGAAMTELAAIDVKLNVYPTGIQFASYTQGCPRVGNAAFSELYTQQIDASFREVHWRDVVPHLPPQLLGFQHAPLEIWWTEDWTSYQTCNSVMTGEDPNCSDSLTLTISVSDHLTYGGIDIGGYCDSNAAAASTASVAAVAPSKIAKLKADINKH